MSVEKRRIRRLVWERLERSHVVRPPLPCRGRIPNFVGAEEAAERLSETPEWEGADVVFVGPDSPQRPVRELALRFGKVLVMASPRLRRGFIVLTPSRVGGQFGKASTIRGAFRYGRLVDQPPRVDLMVIGSVAVDRDFNRLGKGGGYGDREARMLRALYGFIPYATTVHPLQIVDRIPSEPHDVKVDLVATPSEVLRRM